MARGLGTRMRKATGTGELSSEQAAAADTGLKAMIPIGRPFLDYVLSALADAGFRQVCLVIGPEHDVVREYYTATITLSRLSVEVAIQAEARGTADAVLAAARFVGDDYFLVINSDNYYPVSALAALRELGQPGLACFSRAALLADGHIPAERIAKFAVVSVDDEGGLERIVEKPDEATLHALGADIHVSMNCWLFSPKILAACHLVQPSPRGELELTDAVTLAMTRLDERFHTLRFDMPVLDLSSRTDIAAVATRLAGVEVRL